MERTWEYRAGEETHRVSLTAQNTKYVLWADDDYVTAVYPAAPPRFVNEALELFGRSARFVEWNKVQDVFIDGVSLTDGSSYESRLAAISDSLKKDSLILLIAGIALLAAFVVCALIWDWTHFAFCIILGVCSICFSARSRKRMRAVADAAVHPTGQLTSAD